MINKLDIQHPGKIILTVPRFKLSIYQEVAHLAEFPIRYKIVGLNAVIHVLHPDQTNDFSKFWAVYRDYCA